jgi:hypothetical protein
VRSSKLKREHPGEEAECHWGNIEASWRLPEKKIYTPSILSSYLRAAGSRSNIAAHGTSQRHLKCGEHRAGRSQGFPPVLKANRHPYISSWKSMRQPLLKWTNSARNLYFDKRVRITIARHVRLLSLLGRSWCFSSIIFEIMLPSFPIEHVLPRELLFSTRRMKNAVTLKLVVKLWLKRC